MNFDPSQYETVKARKIRFYKDHPDGRIIAVIMNTDLDEKAVVKAYIYLDSKPDSVEKSTGHALELRDKEKSISSKGKEFESVNYTSWLENAEESAVGRALDNAGYASNMKPSLDEMEKAKRMSKLSAPTSATQAPAQPKVKAPLSNLTMPMPLCELCGSALMKGKYGYFCPNFKDGKGKHTSMKEDEYQSWLSANEDVPF